MNRGRREGFLIGPTGRELTMSDVTERCPICNSGTRRDEPEYGKGAHSFSCGTVFRSNGDVAFRWGSCVERAEKWLRRQLAQAQAEVERLRRERETLAAAVMAWEEYRNAARLLSALRAPGGDKS